MWWFIILDHLSYCVHSFLRALPLRRREYPGWGESIARKHVLHYLEKRNLPTVTVSLALRGQVLAPPLLAWFLEQDQGYLPQEEFDSQNKWTFCRNLKRAIKIWTPLAHFLSFKQEKRHLFLLPTDIVSPPVCSELTFWCLSTSGSAPSSATVIATLWLHLWASGSHP